MAGSPVAARVPWIAVVLLAGLGLRLLIAYVLLPGEGLGSDLRLFEHWAQVLADYGPGGFYGNAGFADYPPGYLYVLWMLGVVGDAIAGLLGLPPADVIAALVKVPAIAADIAIGYLLYRSASRWWDARAGLIAAALFLFIPVTWYDSALWGQVDAIGSLLLLGAVLLLIEGWSEPAVAVAMLAAVTKPQYAIGLAVVGAVLVGRHLFRPGSGPVPEPGRWLGALDRRLGGWFTQRQGFRRLAACAGVGIAVLVVALIPFDLPSLAPPGLAEVPIVGSLAGFLSLVGSAAAYYNVLTVNAFNGWALVGPTPLTHAIGHDYMWTYDALPLLGGIPAVTLGSALLALVAAIVVVTLLLRDDRMAILVGFTVLAVAFFVLPTRVHERYLFPAFAVGALLAATSVRWRWWYLLLGLASVANLHAVLTLPYDGYGTPGIQALPLGAALREDAAVAAVGIGTTLLFVAALAAFARGIAWPAVAGALRAFGEWRRSGGPSRVTSAASARLSSARVPSRRLRRSAVRAAPALGPTPGPPALAGEGGGRLDRRDLAVFVLLVAVTLGTRVYRLDTPRSMYFDESWHATTATEFLQDWRYGIPHAVTEWTHPHLAKYAMAAGIVAFGNDRVTGVEDLGATVRDAAFEPSFVDPGRVGAIGGDRIIVATGNDVRVAEHGRLDAASIIPLPGAASVAVDPDQHWVLVGTDDGTLWGFPSAALDDLAATGIAPEPHRIGTIDGPVQGIWAVGDGRLLVRTDGDRLLLVDEASAAPLGSLTLPGLAGILPLTAGERRLVIAAVPSGLVELDATTLAQVGTVPIPGGATGLDLVDGNAFDMKARQLLGQPTLYVATGDARIETVLVEQDGSLTPAGGFPMPGPVSGVRWDRPTNLVHVLGTTPGGGPTIYVVEPHANAVFADAVLPFTPTTWLLDVQPSDPAHDRQRALAFAPDGTVASVDVGSNAFAWRLPGVVAGAVTAGLLFLLARLLFRRRTVGLLFAALIALDGLLFTQSRLAMNDVYVELFMVAGLTLLAYLLGSGAGGRRERLELILGPPLMGLLYGLALASKWVGAYAIGAALLIVLLRSAIGRRLALVGIVGLAGLLGYMAIADDPPNVTFLLIMVGACVVLGVGIVRAGPPAVVAPRWAEPRWRFGLPFAWVLACLIVVPLAVYFASYIPWALSTAGGPQLLAGWPSGNTGQTFLDLQAAMYRYHDEFRLPHGASSPWWAWPFDLKPIWGYLETFVGGTQGSVLGVGNPFIFWLAIPAFVFGAWQGWRRRSAALGFVVVAFLCLWLPWARIDRVAFNYHFYAALPFALLLLAYFLAELWEGPSVRTWLFARVSVVVVLLAPALLWIGKGPLCWLGGVTRVDPTAAVCQAPLSSVAMPVGLWLVGALVASWFVFQTRRPRRLVGGVLVLVAAASLVLYPTLAAWPLPDGWALIYQTLLPTWDVSFQFASNTAAAVSQPLLGIGTLVVLLVVAATTGWAMYLARGWGSGAPRGGPSEGPLGSGASSPMPDG